MDSDLVASGDIDTKLASDEVVVVMECM
jgi:hypothetical protein